MKFVKTKNGIAHQLAGGLDDAEVFESLLEEGFDLQLEAICGFISVYSVMKEAVVTCLTCLSK